MSARLLLAAAAAAFAAVPAAQAATAPVVNSLSATSVARSGRVVISGSGFGATRGASTVTVGGVAAPVVRWSDTLVTAYAPEGAPLGTDEVRVTVGGTSSSPVPLVVEARQAAGRVLWRFAVDGQYVLHRPAVGPDGGVVVVSSLGDVYSLAADGGLRWVQPGAGGDGVPSIGPDGTVYVAAGSTVTAIAPDGAVKWRFTEPSDGQGVMAGPTVGPDGNIYVISDFGGIGAFALSPAGRLLWSNPGDPRFQEHGQIGVELVFGAGQLFAGFDEQGVALSTVFGLTLGGSQRWANQVAGSDDMFMQFQRQPATGADGSLYLTGMGGANGWSLYRLDAATGAVLWNYSPYPSNGMSPPDVGPDGSVYFSRSLSYLESVAASGRSRWTFFDGTIVDYPIVGPDGSVVVAGDRPNFGEPGSARG